MAVGNNQNALVPGNPCGNRKMELTAKQRLAVELATLGHNCLICGQACAGKSTTLRDIIATLVSRGNCVCLCHHGHRMPPAATPCNHPPQVKPTVYTTTPVSIWLNQWRTQVPFISCCNYSYDMLMVSRSAWSRHRQKGPFNGFTVLFSWCKFGKARALLDPRVDVCQSVILVESLPMWYHGEKSLKINL